MCTVCMLIVPTMKPSGARFRLTRMCPPPLVSRAPFENEDLLNAWQLAPRICVEQEDAAWNALKLAMAQVLYGVLEDLHSAWNPCRAAGPQPVMLSL